MTGGMMFKGTSGKYAYRERYSDSNEFEVYPLRNGPPSSGEWAALCTCHDQYIDDFNGGSEAEFNARLFAAAPELLEALMKILSEYDSWKGYNDDGLEEETELYARAAIAKALGEQK